jgi:hypothetical protein
MGALVEQPIPTLFGGVSTQPAPVRQANQTETGVNAKFSVFTGGFEKRPPTQLVSALSFLDITKEYAVHPINRDSSNQFFLLASDGELLAVNAITGAQVTVTIADSTRYFLIDNYTQGTSTGVLTIDAAGNSVTQLGIDSSETTFAWSWEMDDAVTGRFKVEGSVDGIVWNDIQTGIGGAASGTFNTTIGAVATGDHNYIRVTVTTGMAGATDGITLKATFKDLTYLVNVDPEDLRFVSVADATFILNTNVNMRMAEVSSGTVTNTKQTFSDLAAPTGAGTTHRVSGSNTDGFGTYYVIDDAATSTYLEVVDPNGYNTVDATSMPHIVTFDGTTFTYSAQTWKDKVSGDDEVNPPPAILGGDITVTAYGPSHGLKGQDINFYRNRLAILADEQVFCTQAGDTQNIFAEKAVDVLDTDPVERAATTNEVNILKFAAVFRKILFATSAEAQFELTSNNAFTPESALFDQATAYKASPLSKPATMGDVLYFASTGLRHALVYEYFFDETTLSNTAADVTAHAEGFLPNDVLQMATDSTENTLFVLTTAEQQNIYEYRTFFDGGSKLQTSWAKYTFGTAESDCFIHGIATMSGYLVMITERATTNGSSVFQLEQMPIDREAQDATVGFTPFLDERHVLTGTYDSTDDYTFFTLSIDRRGDAVFITGPGFTEPGAAPTVFYPNHHTLALASVTAGQTVIIGGETFTGHATTTTVANREFSIAGADIGVAGELHTCLTDATYGVADTWDVTDNGNGSLTLFPKNGGVTTNPTLTTGTAIGATITLALVNTTITAAGDYTEDEVWAGRPYTMSVKLSELFFRSGDPEGKAVITGRLQLKDISFKLEDTGYVRCLVEYAGRADKTYTFEGKEVGIETTVIGAASIAESTSFKVPIWSDSRNVDITLENDEPQPCIVTSAAWRGFFNEVTRQE